MLRLLKFLFFGDAHMHKWETVRTVDVAAICGTVTGRDYECKCEICGKIKRFRV